jgi:transcriptional regulator GlxA family with amidase domain
MKFKLVLLALLIILSGNLKSEKMNVGVLIYEGVYVLDFTGPIEVFTDTFIDDTAKAFNVFTVSKNIEMIKAHSGLMVYPDYNFNEAPNIDILIIPGGNSSLADNDSVYSDWIKDRAQKSKYAMSVCTGAFIFAKTGLLNGLEATTWHGAQKRLQKKYPEIKVKADRWTDNGQFLTTSGVSAGIDGSLYLVSKIFNKEIAKKTAEYMDYEHWK